MQYIKLGFGRCTSEANQELRSGLIDREEAVQLVRRFDGEFPKKYHEECLEYLGMSQEEFDYTVDKFHLPYIWQKVDGEWRLKHIVE